MKKDDNFVVKIKKYLINGGKFQNISDKDFAKMRLNASEFNDLVFIKK